MLFTLMSARSGLRRRWTGLKSQKEAKYENGCGDLQPPALAATAAAELYTAALTDGSPITDGRSGPFAGLFVLVEGNK